MEHTLVVGGEDIQIWRVAANILGGGWGANNS
jgi:hypothetical protein